MANYLLICRSLTYAQRAEKALLGNGIPASIMRTPKEIPTNGCGYCIRIKENRLADALKTLNAAGLQPSKIFSSYPHDLYLEVEK